MARLAAILNQEPPLEHNVFGYRENTLLEHRPHLMRKPIIQLSAKVGVADEFNTKPDFGEGHRAHIEKFERLGGDEGEDFLFWLGRRSSESILVSSSQTITTRLHARA